MKLKPIPLAIYQTLNRAAFEANLARVREQAFATIPHDKRAPDVVAKADEDLRKQQEEMGDVSDET